MRPDQKISTPSHAWVQAFPSPVTVCDRNGIITEMNDAAAESFVDSGGRALLGQSLLDCHPEPARSVVRDLLATGRTNIYTIQKNGRRKLIVQSPWYHDEQRAGIVELSIPLPDIIPHFDRDPERPLPDGEK
jgi:transcriptional regulator with PAS, ATPase and Fis domain